MHKHKVVIGNTGILQTIDTIVNGFLTIASTWEYPAQLSDHKLVGV